MNHYHARLPLPPSVNNNKWVNPKTGRIIQKDESRQWKKDVFFFLKDFPTLKEGDSWALNLVFNFHYVSRPRRIDTDNRLKPIFDAIAARIGSDDSNLTHYTVSRKSTPVKEKRNDYVDVTLSVPVSIL